MIDIIPRPADFDAPRMIIPAPPNPRYAHLGWPKVVTASNGNMVIGLLAGKEHSPARGECRPAVYLSRDNGENFEGPRVLAEMGAGREFHHSGNIAMGLAGDGAIFLMAMAMTGDSSRVGMFGWRSNDNGETWREVDASAIAGKAGSVYGRVVHVGGDRLLVWGMQRPGATLGEKGIWMAASNNNGGSWGEPKIISRESLGEPAFCKSGDRLIGLVRENMAACYRLAISDDLGESWAFKPSGVGDGLRLPSPFIVPAPRDPALLYALQTDRRHDDDSANGAIYLWTANADELRWQRIATVARFPSGEEIGERPDFGYPWMTPVGDEEWFLAFYCGRVRGACSIWGMKLRLD